MFKSKSTETHSSSVEFKCETDTCFRRVRLRTQSDDYCTGEG